MAHVAEHSGCNTNLSNAQLLPEGKELESRRKCRQIFKCAPKGVGTASKSLFGSVCGQSWPLERTAISRGRITSNRIRITRVRLCTLVWSGITG